MYGEQDRTLQTSRTIRWMCLMWLTRTRRLLLYFWSTNWTALSSSRTTLISFTNMWRSKMNTKIVIFMHLPNTKETRALLFIIAS